MKRIFILLLALLTLGADQKPNCDDEAARKIFARQDWDTFSPYTFPAGGKDPNKLKEIPPDKLTEDDFAKYYIGIMPSVNSFSNGSGEQVIVIVTHTDNSRGDTYYFKKNNIVPDMDPFRYLLYNDLCTPEREHPKCIKIKDTKAFLQKSIKYAPPVDDKYFITQKGIKLGMSQDEVIKIYGQPDLKQISKSDKSKATYIWKIDGVIEVECEEVPLEGAKLEEARKANKKIWNLYQATVEFINGKVERIHLHYFNPG